MTVVTEKQSDQNLSTKYNYHEAKKKTVNSQTVGAKENL